MENRKYKCYHYSAGRGYESHSCCSIYGSFRCDYPKDHERFCTQFLDKEDEQGVKNYKTWEFLSYIEESVQEVEDQIRQIRRHIKIILQNIGIIKNENSS